MASDLLELAGSWLLDLSGVFRHCVVHGFSHGLMTWLDIMVMIMHCSEAFYKAFRIYFLFSSMLVSIFSMCFNE